MQDIRFGFQAAASDVAGVPDQQLYADLMSDCELGHRLGYDAAWLLEHHFSDYYPTPSPLLMMAHIAAKFPDLSLGTSVLVLPWYHPLRLAEEIAMLNSLTEGTLHLGIGRGTARMEYDAYNIDMNEGRARFSEVFKIVEQGLSGRPFTHHGQFWNIEQPIRIRPAPEEQRDLPALRGHPARNASRRNLALRTRRAVHRATCGRNIRPSTPCRRDRYTSSCP